MLRMITLDDPPLFVRRWTRGMRLLAVTIGLLVSAFAIPAAVLGVLYASGIAGVLDKCDALVSVATNWRCTFFGRGLLMLALAVIIVPPSLVWARFLGRTWRYRDVGGSLPVNDAVEPHVTINPALGGT